MMLESFHFAYLFGIRILNTFDWSHITLLRGFDNLNL